MTISLIKLKYFEVVSNQEEYFRVYENICCMVFLNNNLITLSHIVFNISMLSFPCKNHKFFFYVSLGFCCSNNFSLSIKNYMMQGTCSKRSSETTYQLLSHQLLQGLIEFSISVNLRET